MKNNLVYNNFGSPTPPAHIVFWSLIFQKTLFCKIQILQIKDVKASTYIITFQSPLKRYTYFGFVQVHQSLLQFLVSSGSFLKCIDFDIFKEVVHTDLFFKEVFVHIHILIINKKQCTCLYYRNYRYLKSMIIFYNIPMCIIYELCYNKF